MPKAIPLETMFADKVIPEALTGCWLWSGALGSDGYGVISKNSGGVKKTYRAHRLSYALHVGPVPDGLMVCHHCDNPACVAPHHLFLGDAFDNIRDCVKKGRHSNWIPPESKKATHCKRGHEFTEENTYNWRGTQHCRQCNLMHVNEYQKRKHHVE